jgi:hypothetical protein
MQTELPKMERIKGFPDYSITRCGRVFSHRTSVFKELKPSLSVNGYKQITLRQGNTPRPIKLHQILAIHFLNHELNGLISVVDHIDGDRLNNKLSNLQIISTRENCSKDKPDRGLMLGVCLTPYGRYRSRIEIEGKRCNIGTFDTPEEAGQAYQSKLAEIESEVG